MIATRGLRFRYPGATADTLAGIDWQAAPGEIVLLAGQSGSGKSSLLRCLNGLIPHFHGGHFAGEVTIAGQGTRQAMPRDLARLVGTVFQDPETQLVTDNAEDELAFALENLGFDGHEIQSRINAICDRLGIDHLRDRRVATLSGGERQMLAIAAALAPGPRALILDEPTSQLDPQSTARILDALRKLHRETGLTTIIAEHRIRRVLPLADSVLLLEGGRATRSHPAEAIPALHAAGLLPDAKIEPPPPSSPSGSPLAELVDLHFSYGERRVLGGASLRIYPGDTLALMGANGSGKTTLLKHLIGLLRPQRGAVRVDGRDVADVPVHRIARHIGYVPQQPALILHRETVEDELRFTLGSLGREGDPLATLRSLGIAQHAGRHPLDLSGGERQRAAIAALAVARPRLLLLDEPTRGLPWSEKRRLALQLRDFAAAGQAVLVATHDADFAAIFASRALRLSDGRLSEEARAPERQESHLSLLTPSKSD